jgi:5,10-methylenetetrahydromethanopterin reductase
MDFGVCLMPKPDRCADDARLAEACGFTHVWLTDSPVMAGDLYVCMALVANATQRVKIGAGVAIAGTRIAPVTASALASLNQIAPGRVILGIGTGNTARRAMGLPPCSLRDLREHVRVVRGLLSGGEVEYCEGEMRRTVRFFHRDLNFVNTTDKVPIYVAANQPKAMELAGEIGDGFITSRTNTVEGWHDAWKGVSASAQRHGKNPASLYTTMLTTAALMRPGETMESPRVKAEAGPWAMVALHSLYELGKRGAAAPPPLRALFAEYAAYSDEHFRTDDQYYLKLHDGHGLYLQADEERFATRELIQYTTMTSGPEELLERLRALGVAGVKQVAFIPTPQACTEFIREFSEKIIARF